MPVNLDALKKKLNELNGNNKRDKLWRPEAGKTYQVRILPPRNSDIPFIERFFYYEVAPYAIMCPYQFGKEDPVKDFIDETYRSGSKEQKEVVKKIMPRSAQYVPIIVRGEEAKGVYLWKTSYTVYKSLLEIFFDEDFGDITDPIDGFDIKVTVEKLPGKKFPDTKVKARTKSSVLTEDESLLKQWMASVPNVDEMFDVPAAPELRAKLDTWLSGGSPQQQSEQTSGEERSSGGGGDELDRLESSLKQELKKPVQKDDDDDDDDNAPALKPTPKKQVKSKALDDVFKDLED